eukprot:171645_1
MASNRKLQMEIDRTLKKVDEGVEEFDAIWEKVYSAQHQNQKEKYEGDLKKEIKKLQRHRDNIKSWISSNDIKDKKLLIDTRKLIETKMEQFKVCEKETKTKAFSKEGLARAATMDPEELKKNETREYLQEKIDHLATCVDGFEAEEEKLQSGKRRKITEARIATIENGIASHKYHIARLEQVMRLMDNDEIPAESIEDIKEDLEFYIETSEDVEAIEAFVSGDAFDFYEMLDLESLTGGASSVVNVEKGNKPEEKDDDEKPEKKVSKASKEKMKSSSSGSIPMTIGRPVVQSKKEREKAEKAAAKAAVSDKPAAAEAAKRVVEMQRKDEPSVSDSPAPIVPEVQTAPREEVGRDITKSQTSDTPPTLPMASKLSAQQQQQVAPTHAETAVGGGAGEQAFPPSPGGAGSEQFLQPPIQPQQQQDMRKHHQQQQQQPQQQGQPIPQQIVLSPSRAQTAAAKLSTQHQLLPSPIMDTATGLMPSPATPSHQGLGGGLVETGDLNASQQPSTHLPQQGLGGGLVETGDLNASQQPSTHLPQQQQGPIQPPAQGGVVSSINGGGADGSGFGKQLPTPAELDALEMLDLSVFYLPRQHDAERPTKKYVPQNPYQAPQEFPSSPSPLFEQPSMFAKFPTDSLFFVFYFQQGTYQQYLAAKELKKQSWRYHSKYMTWFQRHEEPVVTTDEYERGTYVYFDYETDWCQRIKSDFTFVYEHLEDSLE